MARRSAPLSCGGSPDQIGERDVQGVGEDEKVFQVGDAVRVLPAVDRPMVAAYTLTELDLSEPGPQARRTEALSDLPAAGGHPVGHGVERHPPTLERSCSDVFARPGKFKDLATGYR